MKLVSGSDRDWIFTNSNLVNGEILNQTIHAKLPPGAENAHVSPGGDFDELSYHVDLATRRPKGWLEAGILLLVLGGALGFASTRVRRKSQLSGAAS
jgi:hypothetical protein